MKVVDRGKGAKVDEEKDKDKDTEERLGDERIDLAGGR